jgi:DNA-binding response OmpR family regulator
LATILLVDDDPKILRPLKLLVEFDGFLVLTARDGEEALVATVTQRPDLIVTDWMMPRVDGVELCRRLRNDSATAGIPVVMLSAALPPPQKERLWDVLLLTPTPINELMKEIRYLLEHAQADAHSRI